MNICPGACVKASPGFACIITACGVTPQAQNTGTSPAATGTASPKSGRCTSRMPRAAGSPTWTGAPCTAGKRLVICTARTTSCAGQRAHTDHQRTVEHTGGFTRTIGNEHGNIHAQFDVPHVHTGIHQGMFKGKTTPEKETDEIVPPIGPEIIDLLNECTISVHTITWNVRTDVGAWRKLPWFGIARVKHFKEWTGLRVALAKEQKIIGQGSRHHCQVGLRIARCQASRWTAPLACTNTLTYLVRASNQLGHA